MEDNHLDKISGKDEKEEKKKAEHINSILKDVQKNIKPSKGPLTSIDPKKMERASKDVEIAAEVAGIVKKGKKEKKKDLS